MITNVSSTPALRITATPAKLFEKKPLLSKVMNRELCIAPKDLMSNHEHQEALWNVAKTAAIIGYLALSTATFAITSIFAPQLILFVTFAVFLIMPTAISAYSSADDRSIEHSVEKTKFARIAEIQQQLLSLSPNDLRKKFSDWGLTPWKIDKFKELEGGLKSLIPGFASMLYLAEHSHELFLKKKNLLKESPDNDAYRTLKLREAFFLERAGLSSKINAAYMFGLLSQPFCQKSLDDIGHVPMITAETYALENLYGRKPPLFIFKKEGESPLFEEQVRPRKSPQDIRELSDLLL